MPCLIDTNILVYRFDPRDPVKQESACALIRKELTAGEARLCPQTLVEFVAAATRPLKTTPSLPLLTPEEATYEAEELLHQFEVVPASAEQYRLAIRGWRTYGLSWFDAHLWSFAEHHGLDTIYSEDFQHGRTYGAVRVINPFQSE